MPHDYIPRPDSDFSAWANHYVEAVHKFWEAQGLDVTDLKPLDDALELWNKDYPAHVAAQARAEAAAATKKQARYGLHGEAPGGAAGVPGLEPEARRIAAFIQTYPTTTDADRATIGIRVRPPTRTPTNTPTSKPLIVVAGGGRLTHELRLVDESTPTRRARPRGVQRAEVFVALAPAGAPVPANPETFRYIGSVSSGSTVLTFEPDKGGLQAYYVARWVATGGGAGPWSDTASATVAA